LLKINAAKRNDTTDMNFINYALTSAAKLRQWTDEVLPNGARPQEDLVDITEIVKEVKVLMSFQLGAYGISVNIDKCIPIIFGNKTQIFRLFKNLMENAVKHAKTKDLAIDIYLESIDLGKNIANIIFQDNGARLAKKEVSKLSDIVNFGRISSTKGLSICKKFAARNSGNVTYVPSDIGCKYCISLNCDPHRKNGRINYE
jgi:light-regulated signal transduction histidine kinase (bacteriophytochrome)